MRVGYGTVYDAGNQISFDSPSEHLFRILTMRLGIVP